MALSQKHKMKKLLEKLKHIKMCIKSMLNVDTLMDVGFTLLIIGLVIYSGLKSTGSIG